ncbi:MAG: response regulator [Vulcanimicrobiota bacterium]
MKWRPLRILLIEDDDNLRGSLEGALREDDFDVTSASSGELALHLAKDRDFELIITDIKVPGIDGLEALRRMKLDRPQLESIVITGYSSEEESIRAVRLGVGEYLRKPFPLTALREAINRAQVRIEANLLSQRRHQIARDTAVWALTRGRQADLSRRSELARRAAHALGYESEAENLELATLVALTESAEPETPPALTNLLEGALPRLLDVIEQLKNYPHYEGQTGLLLNQLENDAMARHEIQGMVTTGYLCEVAGELGLAEQTYTTLLTGQAGPRQRLEAHLGLARIRAAHGDAQGSQQHLEPAVALAQELSPELAAHAFLEGGLTLARLGVTRATDFLQKAREHATPASMDYLRSSLALAFLGAEHTLSEAQLETALAGLLQGPNLGILLASAWWLLPGLLHRPESPTADKVLARLVREAPSQVRALLDSEKLAPAKKERLHRLVEAIRPGDQESSMADDAESGTPAVRIYSLGGFEILQGERRLDRKVLGGRLQVSLLAYVAASSHPVAEDILLETFWPEDAARARKRLTQVISYIRTGFREFGVGLCPLERRRGAVGLNPDLPIWHDYTALRTIVDTPVAPEPNWDELESRVDQIFGLYRGPFMASCYEDWALVLRDQLDRDVIRFLMQVGSRAEAAGRAATAARCGEKVLEFDGCHQEAALLVMEASLAMRRPETALRCFKTVKSRLDKELGIEPSIDLLRSEQRALLLG